jgi:nucleotide-binding universal stress UspA family protein
MVGFLTWKSSQHEEEVIPGTASKLAFASYSQDDNDKTPKIIIPVANPRNIPQLIQIGATISKEKKASLIILKVAIVNEQMPLDYDHEFVQKETDVLNLAIAEAAKHGVKATSLLKIGYNPARAILETARERKCKLLILGWKGFSTSRERILGQITDTIVTHARCDLMLVKLSKKDIGNIILPSAGGEHARSAEIYSAILAKDLGSKLSICHVKTEKSPSQEDKPKALQAQDRIRDYNGLETDLITIEDSNIADGILKASEAYDTIIVGATRDSIYQQILFGSIPEIVAKDTEKNVIVVKHYHRVKALMGRVMGE